MEPKKFFIATVDGVLDQQTAITVAEGIREKIPNLARVIFVFSDEGARNALVKCLPASFWRITVTAKGTKLEPKLIVGSMKTICDDDRIFCRDGKVVVITSSIDEHNRIIARLKSTLPADLITEETGTMSDRDVFYVRSTNYTETVTRVIPSLIDDEARLACDAGQRNESLMKQYRSEHPLVAVFMPLSKVCDESAFKRLGSIIDDVARQGRRLAIAGVDSAEPTVISNVTAMEIMPPLQHGDRVFSMMELIDKFGRNNVMLYA